MKMKETRKAKQNMRPPSWAKVRKGWVYAGWVSRKDTTPEEFAQYVKNHKDATAKNRQIRETDFYEQGAVHWWKPATETSSRGKGE